MGGVKDTKEPVRLDVEGGVEANAVPGGKT